MRFKALTLVASACVLLSGCAFSDANSDGYMKLKREECVPYARRVSDIQLYGDAHTWWNKAQGVYMRGNVPAPGAVLVLAKTSRLPRGHLAVVVDTIAPREIRVTHTNWGDDFMSRRLTYERVTIEDVSAANDWTSIRFWNHDHKAFGFPYKAYGFIYNHRPLGYGAMNPSGPQTMTVDMFGNMAPIVHPIVEAPRNIPQVPPNTNP